MKKKKVLILTILLTLMCTVSIGSVGAISGTGNGSAGSADSSASGKCSNNTLCNNNSSSFKAVSIALYYVDQGKKNLISKKMIVYNGKRRDLMGTTYLRKGETVSSSSSSWKKQWHCNIGENTCKESSWFENSEDYGYDDDAIFKAFGGSANKVHGLKGKKIAKWIARLMGDKKSYKKLTNDKLTAREYLSSVLTKPQCFTDEINGKEGACADSKGYRIIIEPILGFQKDGKSSSGELKSYIAQHNIGQYSVNKKKIAGLMYTTFDDVGIKHGSKKSCSYDDLKNKYSGCGWLIIDIGQRNCSSYNTKTSVFTPNAFKGKPTKLGGKYKYFDESGVEITYNKKKEQYNIKGKYYDKDDVEKYLKSSCTTLPKTYTCGSKKGTKFYKNKYVSGATYYDNGGNKITITKKSDGWHIGSQVLDDINKYFSDAYGGNCKYEKTEHSCEVYKETIIEYKKDENGNEVLDENGKKIKVNERLKETYYNKEGNVVCTSWDVSCQWYGKTKTPEFVKSWIGPGGDEGCGKVCLYDSDNNTWYDNNGDAHDGTPSNRIMTWINRDCQDDPVENKVSCTNCDSTDKDGKAFEFTEEVNTSWQNIASSYHGGSDEDSDAVNKHYLKAEGNNEGETIYCKENYKVYLPNGTTTNLKSVKAGRYITVNLADGTELTNLKPIKIEKTTKCIATNSEGTNLANTSARAVKNADNPAEQIKTYLGYDEESGDEELDDDELGTITVNYNMGSYNITTKLNAYKTERSDYKTGIEEGYTTGSKTTTTDYTLPDNFYRYYRVKDGKAVKDIPADINKYTDVGLSTLPVPFTGTTTGTITFEYEPNKDVTNAINDSTIKTEGKSCISSNKLSYTCNLSTGNSCSKTTDVTGKAHYIGKNGTEVSSEEEYNKQCNPCKVQLNSDTNEYDYYYKGEKVEEDVYKKYCNCSFDKDETTGETKYFIKGKEVEEDVYQAACPTCDRGCPTGETCCWDTSMSCSVNGNCPIGGKKIIYRTIDLNNPFPGQNNNNITAGRKTGSNWCTYDKVNHTYNCNNQNDNSVATTGSNKNTTVEKHIKNNNNAESYDIYQKTPQYSFTLDSKTIQDIRDYNKKQSKNDDGYDDFTLNCYDVGNDVDLETNGIYSTRICKSTFFRSSSGSTTSNKVLEIKEGTCSSDAINNIALCSERGDN